MPKFRVTEKLACWVSWHYEIEADSSDTAFTMYMEGDKGDPVGEPEIGDSIDFCGDDTIVEEIGRRCD